jgi:hypothetical protein
MVPQLIESSESKRTPAHPTANREFARRAVTRLPRTQNMPKLDLVVTEKDSEQRFKARHPDFTVTEYLLHAER